MKPNTRKWPFTVLVCFLALLSLGACLKCTIATAPTVEPLTEAYSEEVSIFNVQNVAHEDEDTIFITEKKEENSTTTREVTIEHVVVETTIAEEVEFTEQVEEMTVAVETTTETEIEDVVSEEEVEVKTKPAEDEFEGEGISYTQAELDFMAAAICQEAGGESRYVKVRVANVMVNRVLSDSFPNTIEGVLTQRGQYDLYSGRNFPDWATEEMKDECYEVARNVLSGEERPFPEKVVFQAEFRQGNGTYEHCDSVLGGRGYYFCY